MDWEQQELSFKTQKGMITLKGGPKLHGVNVRSEVTSTGIECVNQKLSLFKAETAKKDVIPNQIEDLLKEFDQVFQESNVLPLKRGFEHVIRLTEGP